MDTGWVTTRSPSPTKKTKRLISKRTDEPEPGLLASWPSWGRWSDRGPPRPPDRLPAQKTQARKQFSTCACFFFFCQRPFLLHSVFWSAFLSCHQASSQAPKKRELVSFQLVFWPSLGQAKQSAQAKGRGVARAVAPFFFFFSMSYIQGYDIS